MAKYVGYKRPKDTKKTLKRMLHYMGIHKWSMALVAVLVCISSSANIFGTYLVKPVVNKYILSGDVPGLIRMLIFMGILYGVKVDGVPVEEYSLAHLRDAVAMVLQKNTLFSGSLRENLLWGNPEAPDEELLRACRIARVDEFLDRLENGLDTEMGQGGSNISGGQKQSFRSPGLRFPGLRC